MIGIFDSGIGGMTVARAIEQLIPDRSICYLGDLARTPYGSKSDDAILEYSIENSKFLIERGAQVIVIACNSASSVATEKLRQMFSIPIIEVITPAVTAALDQSNGKLGIIGTTATIRNNIYKRMITSANPDFKVYSQPCPLLVPLVEEGWLNKPETKMILRRYLSPLKQKQIDTLILGCTHYPLMKNLIQPRIGKRVRLIDSSETIALHLKKLLQEKPELLTVVDEEVSHKYFVTDLTDTVQNSANSIFQRSIELIPT